MQREIKFRVWNGEAMISPDYVDRKGTAFWKENSIPTYSDKVMQYTGMKDKNGVEIYEGDIVKLFSTTVQIIYQSGAFGYMSKAFDDFIVFGKNYHFKWNKDSSNKIEVIGNIYEHKHLLN